MIFWVVHFCYFASVFEKKIQRLWFFNEISPLLWNIKIQVKILGWTQLPQDMANSQSWNASLNSSLLTNNGFIH
jgi:hypothetical protein